MFSLCFGPLHPTLGRGCILLLHLVGHLQGDCPGDHRGACNVCLGFGLIRQ